MPSALRIAERKYLANDGKIDATEAAELKKLGTAKGADKNEVRDILANDAFDGDARKTFAKALGSEKAPAQSMFAGVRIADGVQGVKELGPTKGFDQREQAVSAARMAGAEHAVAIKDSKGRWHAVETTADFKGGMTTDYSAMRAVEGIPGKASIAAAQEKLAKLKEANASQKEINEATEDLATAITGMPSKLTVRSQDRDADVLSINANLGAAGKHGPEGKIGEDFDPKSETALEISRTRLETPAKAQGTVFHESTHKQDYELAQDAINRFGADKYSPAADGPFVKWLQGEVKAKRMSPADAQLITDLTRGANGSTEANAYLRTFIAALQTGNVEVAKEQLSTYAHGLVSKDPNTMVPNTQSPTTDNALKAELEAAYKALPKDMQTEFNKAFADIKDKYPDAWISKFTHGN